MSHLRFPFSCAFLLLISPALSFGQEPPKRDVQALAILQQAFAAMGGSVPADSVATGSVTIVAGSKTDQGTIRILTRGLAQSAEEFQLPDGTRAEIFSGGAGANKTGLQVEERSLEWASSAQSTSFPLILIASALSSADIAFEYVGLEAGGPAKAHHVRLWNTFSARPKLRHLAAFSEKHVWIDAATGLPLKVAYDRRAASGAEPRIPMEVSYSDYRNVGGMLYPFSIEKLYNGTPWATIRITSVAFNTGLTDTPFVVDGRPQ